MSRSSVPTPARWIDPRGQRFGAALSAVILSIAIALAAVWLAALTGIALGVSAAFGTRYFVLGRPWPAVRSAMKLGPPAAPEHEYPPRFAQALGATFVGLGTGLLAVGVSPWGWLPIIAVVVLQVVLATTGYCLGCRLYFVRWYAPALFTRLIRRQVRAAR